MKYTERTDIRMDPVLQAGRITLKGGVVYDLPEVYPPEINPGITRVFPDSAQVESWKTEQPYDRSFKKVKQNREIKMTDYSVGKVTTKRYLASIPRVSTRIVRRHAYLNDGSDYFDEGFVPLSTYYTDNYDAIRAADSFPAVEYSRHFEPEEVNSILNDLKSDVVQNSYSGFDLLTELAEFPETLGMILSFLKAARHPIQGMKALREKYERSRRRGNTHEVAHQEIAGQWMQYRYGIMPLVYSIVDAVKLLEDAMTEFKTDRAFSVLRSKPKPVHATESHIAIYRGHEIKISVVGKSSYTSTQQRLSDLITTNLFLTAWEMIPLSFVIDWFVNVGDVIFSRTSTIVDLAKERKFCYSIRRSLIDRHVLIHNFTDGASRTFGGDFTTFPQTKFWPVASHFSNVRINMGNVLLYERVEESYERHVFQPNTVDFDFGPDLNWMRMLDGYVLSFNKIRKVLKSLS